MSQPAILTPSGILRCAYCRTDDYGFVLTDGRLSEDHVGMRFGDRGRGIRVLYEGEDVTKMCVEAIAGHGDGRVYLYHEVNEHRQICSGGDHAIVVQHRGNVQVVRHPASG